MNYGQLKEQIRDLGFSEDAEIEEFADIVPNAINRAITEINMTVTPIIGTHIIEQDGAQVGVQYYDIEELTKENDVIKFLEFADVPVMIGDGIYERFNDFEVENDNTLVIDGGISGRFKVFYKKAHTPITTDTDDTTEIELPLKAHYLLPLLSSYYIWLEDEKAKAVDYYNQYEVLRDDLISKKNQPRGRILPGGV